GLPDVRTRVDVERGDHAAGFELRKHVVDVSWNTVVEHQHECGLLVILPFGDLCSDGRRGCGEVRQCGENQSNECHHDAAIDHDLSSFDSGFYLKSISSRWGSAITASIQRASPSQA